MNTEDLQVKTFTFYLRVNTREHQLEVNAEEKRILGIGSKMDGTLQEGVSTENQKESSNKD